MLSVDKNLTPAQIKSRIINSVNDVGETGFDHKTGYGLVNAFNALSELYVDKNPQSTLLSGNLDLSKQASDIYITLNHTPPSGVAAGRYIVDRYIAQKTVNHSIIDANTWYLGMKGYGYYEGSSTISHSYYLSSNIASNSFYFGTYFYYVKHEVPSGSVNKWIPWNPHVDGGLNYAVLGIGLAPPIITSLTQSPDPICQGSHGYVYCNLSQGNGNLSYTWTAADLPSGAYITPLGNRCKVTYPNTAKSSDGSSDKIMAPVNEITCIVTNSAGSDTESRSVYFDNDCGSQCPTLAFEHNGKIVNDNPILTKSVSSKPDVTDYYLVQNEVAKTDKKIKLLIHEPAVEHTYLDQVELMEVKVNPNEYVSVSEEGEIVNYKLSRERITFSLGGKEDIGSLLSSNDNNKAQFIAGDSLIIYSDQISTQTKDDLYFVIDGEGPIYKDKTAGVLSTTGLGKTSSANNNKDIYLRPEKSVVGIKLDKNIQNKLTIEFLQDVEIDFISIVKNEKTAKVNKLKLLEAVHSKNGDVKSLVLNIDKNYSEILPGERIDFTFESASSTDEKTAYILKSAGRYERDNVGEMKKGSQKENGVEEIIPTETKLLGNYPNPFNPTTIINFQLKEPGFVSLKVYDVIGREVADLINETKNAGIYKISFDASDLASGIYIYRLRANDFVSSKKMLLAK
ncbi:MAG: T9SS type A sorting domain-containing protein [Ignavibacteriae bacterium]|nr:T9SS type A sorting domain-containing protein [Ignavibacteriota bacterium]